MVQPLSEAQVLEKLQGIYQLLYNPELHQQQLQIPADHAALNHMLTADELGARLPLATKQSIWAQRQAETNVARAFLEGSTSPDNIIELYGIHVSAGTPSPQETLRYDLASQLVALQRNTDVNVVVLAKEFAAELPGAEKARAIINQEWVATHGHSSMNKQ